MRPRQSRLPVAQAVRAAVVAAIGCSMVIGLVMTVVAEFGAAGFGGIAGLIAFLSALPVTLAHAVFIAVPAYLLLRSKVDLSRLNVSLAGALIGLVPAAIYFYLTIGASLLEAMFKRGPATLLCGMTGVLGALIFRNEFLRLEALKDPKARAAK